MLAVNYAEVKDDLRLCDFSQPYEVEETSVIYAKYKRLN